MPDTQPAPQPLRPEPTGKGLLWAPAHRGQDYQNVLKTLHTVLRPRSYVEVGVETGMTLALATCASVGVDPAFKIGRDVTGAKPMLALRQCGSDEFFTSFDPRAWFGSDAVDFFFLDGMHLFEFLLRDFMNAERFSRPNSIIALHDCLPVDMYMTSRERGVSAYPPVHNAGWWTGDVWRLLPTLKKYRPDLRIHCLDAAPTGLVLVTGLDPRSTVLADRYGEIVAEGLALNLTEIGIQAFLDSLPVRSTAAYQAQADLAQHFWL